LVFILLFLLNEFFENFLLHQEIFAGDVKVLTGIHMFDSLLLEDIDLVPKLGKQAL
jgi:hypothetical protein